MPEAGLGNTEAKPRLPNILHNMQFSNLILSLYLTRSRIHLQRYTFSPILLRGSLYSSVLNNRYMEEKSSDSLFLPPSLSLPPPPMHFLVFSHWFFKLGTNQYHFSMFPLESNIYIVLMIKIIINKNAQVRFKNKAMVL